MVRVTLTALRSPFSMTKQRTGPEASPTLTRVATTTAAYPLFVLTVLYGQWLLSWSVLGHRPRPSIDDPKYIDGASWMHDITAIAILGFCPVGLCAAVLNTIHFLRHQNPGFVLSVRLSLILTLWLGTILLLRADPGRVVDWWLD
jgi:hypothetical protein